MKLVTVNSKTVLRTLKEDSEFKKCFVANSSKQLYSLEVLYIDPEELRVEVKAPKGRRTPIDTSMSWDLSFRDKSGAYQAPVKRFLTRDKSLVFFLENYLFFLARREKIRLPTGSRNPTTISFSFDDHRHSGSLVDFNLEGLGIHMKGDWEPVAGDEIKDGSFKMRSHHVTFNSAQVVHLSFTEEGFRVGLKFTDLSEDQLETIKKTFDAWFHSQNPSFSPREDL